MSHSQFHSTNLFILRHAWLNLWDKHMTTGRINQVTTIQMHICATSDTRTTRHFLQWVFITRLRMCLWIFIQSQLKHIFQFQKEIVLIVLRASERITLYLRSHTFQTCSFCHIATKITVFREDYQVTSDNLKENHSVMAYPQVVICNSSSYQQGIHIPLQSGHMFQKNRVHI